jgi:hypothetical protein
MTNAKYCPEHALERMIGDNLTDLAQQSFLKKLNTCVGGNYFASAKFFSTDDESDGKYG